MSPWHCDTPDKARTYATQREADATQREADAEERRIRATSRALVVVWESDEEETA